MDNYLYPKNSMAHNPKENLVRMTFLGLDFRIHAKIRNFFQTYYYYYLFDRSGLLFLREQYPFFVVYTSKNDSWCRSKSKKIVYINLKKGVSRVSQTPNPLDFCLVFTECGSFESYDNSLMKFWYLWIFLYHFH